MADRLAAVDDSFGGPMRSWDNFLTTFANYVLGRIYLLEDREDAIELLEKAITDNTEYTYNALLALLEYHRGLGQDVAADRVLKRIHEHEKRLNRADNGALVPGNRDSTVNRPRP